MDVMLNLVLKHFDCSCSTWNRWWFQARCGYTRYFIAHAIDTYPSISWKLFNVGLVSCTKINFRLVVGGSCWWRFEEYGWKELCCVFRVLLNALSIIQTFKWLCWCFNSDEIHRPCSVGFYFPLSFVRMKIKVKLLYRTSWKHTGYQWLLILSA